MRWRRSSTRQKAPSPRCWRARASPFSDTTQDEMKTSSLQFKVISLMAIAMAVALAVSVFALTRVYGSIQELDRISREDFETQQAILRATVAFKQQVQEWKNVLLRGGDPAKLDLYWQAFLTQ